MTFFLFWFFALLMLGFACAVVFNRNPVASALSLVVSFMGLAALYVMLDAYFIGAIQVLVYAGAVMVLFLFIIMLLDLKAEKPPEAEPGLPWRAARWSWSSSWRRSSSVIQKLPFGDRAFPPLAGRLDDVGNMGRVLFGGYNLPFQVVGVLLLVASVGVVVLSKKELK